MLVNITMCLLSMILTSSNTQQNSKNKLNTQPTYRRKTTVSFEDCEISDNKYMTIRDKKPDQELLTKLSFRPGGYNVPENGSIQPKDEADASVLRRENGSENVSVEDSECKGKNKFLNKC